MLVTIVAFVFMARIRNGSNSVEIVSVYDGDTIFVNIANWPDIIGKRIGVRLRGIDCPEMNDNRSSIHHLAKEARQFVVDNVAYKEIRLENIERDKYFRIVADVYVDGDNLSELLLKNKLAQEYDGGKKQKW
jgi:endonuclease YncB( thermonuclease family)